jgi:tRNA A22 N-methylase
MPTSISLHLPWKVSPSSLDGLVIDVPTASTSTLAQIKIQKPVKGSASQTQTKSYSLKSQSSTLRSKENNGTSTQLIAMAGGNSIAESKEENQRMLEGDSMYVMLPQSHSQQGRYVFGMYTKMADHTAAR